MPRAFLFCAILALISTPPLEAAEDGPPWTGLSAWHAGAYREALPLLGRPWPNPYLEAFRLYYRADCLLRDARYEDAGAALETLFALVDSGAVPRSFRVVDRAGDLAGEARAMRGVCEPGSPAESPSRAFACSSRVDFLASQACLAAGDTANAIAHLTSGAACGALEADSSLFRELFHACESRVASASERTLLALAQGALRRGLIAEANIAIGRVLARKPSDPDALLGRANAILKSGEAERALHAYWRIYDSDAPVKAKASALAAIASIEYDLRRYDKAATHYFMHGAFYRSASSLDLAARIHVREKEWRKAIRAWTLLRQRHRGERLDVPVWIEGGLSEAVLCFWLGRDAEANAILTDVVPRTRGVQNAAALFWLMKTSASDAARRAWSDSLRRAWPRSFYAAIARGDESALVIRGRDSDTGEIDALAGIAADRLARCEAAEADSAFAHHPAVLAFTALLDHGFDEEATAVAQAMTGIERLLLRLPAYDESSSVRERMRRRPVPARVFKLYAEATRHGRGALSLTVLSSASPNDSSGELPPELWYPIFYTDEIRAAGAGLPTSLVLGIIREESRFDPNVVSRAGAIGLMQLMPATASWHAGRRDAIPPGEDDLRDPAKNIRAGADYFRYLLELCDGSVIAALASYNGGHGRMAPWRANFRPAENPLVALEMIGPSETRRYVRKVLDSCAAYAALAGEKGRGE